MGSSESDWEVAEDDVNELEFEVPEESMTRFACQAVGKTMMLQWCSLPKGFLKTYLFT